MELTTLTTTKMEESGFAFSSETHTMKVLMVEGLDKNPMYEDQRVIWKEKESGRTGSEERANVRMYEMSEALGLHVVPHYFDYAEGNCVRVVIDSRHLGDFPDKSNVLRAVREKPEGWRSVLHAATFAHMVGKDDHGSHNMLWSEELKQAFVIDADMLNDGECQSYDLGMVALWWYEAYGDYSRSEFPKAFPQQSVDATSNRVEMMKNRVAAMLQGMTSKSC